jgi:hypothetical protein
VKRSRFKLGDKRGRSNCSAKHLKLFTNKIAATGPNGKPSKPIQDAADRGEGSLAARS